MSLLEDVFLENEAGEAQELERIIEGDEFEERPRSRSDSDGNSAKEDEAEEDKRRVDPTSAKPKSVVKHPRFVLNPARLTGPRGIQIVPEHFKDFKFKGKGHERDDLDLVLKKLEHWAYRLYPKFKFQDCLKKIETLGKKRPVSVQLTKIRMDLMTSDDTVVQRDSSDDEATPIQEPEDEFDKLLQHQIDIARATPAPSSLNKTAGSGSKPSTERSSTMPKGTSSPSINDEQRERMLRSRRMAEERRIARLQQNTSQENVLAKSPNKIDDISIGNKHNTVTYSSNEDMEMNKSVTKDSNKTEVGSKSDIEPDTDGMVVTKSLKCYVPAKKHNKSKIDSSDDDDALVISETVTIDVEKHHNDIGSKSKNIINRINKSNVMDSSEDDDLVINEPIAIDVENHYNDIKKHKKHKIDSSNDDDALVISEPVTIDVEKHHNDIGSKSKNITNRNNNVINSSDDDDLVIKPIAIDVENYHSDIVTAKKHKKNKIDSSDDDNALVLSERVTIDGEKHNDIRSKSKNIKRNNKSNVINSSDDDDDLVINEPIVNNVENHHSDIVTANHNTFNIIDSSEAGGRAIVMNESINVDGYDSNKSYTNKNDSFKTSNFVENNVTMNKGSVDIVIQPDEQKKSNSNVNDSIIHSVSDSNKKHQKNNKKSIASHTYLVESAIDVSEKQSTNKNDDQNILELENVDELMDVDLSDDF